MHSRFHADPTQLSRTEQRQSQRAAVAVALAPVLVLLALTLVIGDVLSPDFGLAGVVAAVAWLVYEMHQYQRSMVGADADADSGLGVLDPLAD